MYRRGAATTSARRVELTTSNGVSWMAPPSIWLTLGTTMVWPASSAEQVSTTANRSPTLTAVRSVFHQQRMGSSAT